MDQENRGAGTRHRGQGRCVVEVHAISEPGVEKRELETWPQHAAARPRSDVRLLSDSIETNLAQAGERRLGDDAAQGRARRRPRAPAQHRARSRARTRRRRIDRRGASRQSSGAGRRFRAPRTCRDRRVAERQALAVGRDHVACGLRPGPGRVRDRFPIGGRHDDARAEALLQQSRAADMIAVTMAHDDVLDVRRIESDLLQDRRSR